MMFSCENMQTDEYEEFDAVVFIIDHYAFIKDDGTMKAKRFGSHWERIQIQYIIEKYKDIFKELSNELGIEIY